MKRANGRIFGWTLASLISALGPAAGAETPGERIMRQMDEAMTRPGDQFFLFDMITKEPGKEERRCKLAVYIKGTEWRRIEFVEPGDVKGMRILVRSIEQMYVYMPAYRKVRRVASHVREQGFMGSAFSHDDACIVVYSPMYQGRLTGETDTHWTIEAVRRPGKRFPYAKLEFDVVKKHNMAAEIRYFNDKGAKVKTEYRTDYVCLEDGICTPMVLKMVDHTRNDLWTELRRLEWKQNLGLEESFFTVRALQRRKK